MSNHAALIPNSAPGSQADLGWDHANHPPPVSTIPLCVDVDGTLVKSDTLVDSVLAMVRQHPAAIAKIPGWLFQGKAAFKHHVTQSVTLDVASLPYNQPLVEFLMHQHAAGRRIFLATAADRTLADRIAAHLGIFEDVLASDGSHNLAGGNKLQAFRARFGDEFSYIGNAKPDLPILTTCLEPMVANPDGALRSGLRSAKIVPVRTFEDTVSPVKAWLKALRLHQWAKNVLIFVPLIMAHAWRLPRPLGPLAGSLIAFLSFGLCASATYIVNDLLDIEADRHHHSKSRRPFAAGNLPAISGAVVCVTFLALSLALALALPYVVAAVGAPLPVPHGMLVWLAIYAVSTTSYSFALKRVVLVDVIVLSGLYTIRIITGSEASGFPISQWLGGFSVFFFLSLAFVKRFAELESLRLREKAPSNGRGYLVTDIEQLRSFGTASAYASVVVLTLYFSNVDTSLYRHPVRLWLILPILLLWVSQLWLTASRGELNEDPVVHAITDRKSLLLGALAVCVVLTAM